MSITWLVTSSQTLETSTDMRIVRGKIVKESHRWKKWDGIGLAESESDQAQEFNGQFTDVLTQSRFNEALLLDRSAPRMNDSAVSIEGVTKLRKGLNPSKAMGPDELHPRILKKLAKELCPVFAHLIQQSLDPGGIPEEWSLANTCPLFKKGDRALASNYRPVSIFCKLPEDIIYSNIMDNFEKHSLLSDRQHAFMKKKKKKKKKTRLWNSLETVINDWTKILV